MAMIELWQRVSSAAKVGMSVSTACIDAPRLPGQEARSQDARNLRTAACMEIGLSKAEAGDGALRAVGVYQ